MTTGPMGVLRTGMKIDGEWIVEDVFRMRMTRIYVLKNLISGITRYLNRQELKDMFMGKRVR